MQPNDRFTKIFITDKNRPIDQPEKRRATKIDSYRESKAKNLINAAVECTLFYFQNLLS